jgi:hypothetical protein
MGGAQRERERERERERWCSLSSWVTVVGGSREREREMVLFGIMHYSCGWVHRERERERERERVVGPGRERVCVVS